MKKKKIIPMIATVFVAMLTSCSGPSSAPYIWDGNGWINVDSKDFKGISSIEKTATEDNVDTYTITYTDGSTDTFTVTNGANGIQGIQGEPGEDGHSPVVSIGDNGNWFVDGVDTGVSAKGEKGDTGATGPQGPQGPQGETGATGEPGEDGLTPYIGENGNWWIGEEDTGVNAEGIDGQNGLTPRIGENGNWWIGDTDTGVKATGSQGPQGETGATGAQGPQGETGPQGEPGEDGNTPYVGENGNWWIGEEDTGIKATGEKGETGATGAQGPQGETGATGPQGPQGEAGKDGNTPYIGTNGNWWIGEEDTGVKAAARSIVSIDKTSSVDNVDTYTIKYSDGTESTFTVTNGLNGTVNVEGGSNQDGTASNVSIGANGNWYIDGTDSGISAKARSITSVAKTSSNENIDTYTITYSDGTSSTFTVTNGVDGEQGEQGIQGKPGKDGHTPVVSIGENGNWFVDGIDTGVSAKGEKGDTGETGPQGPQGETGPQGEPGTDGLTPYIGENGNWWIGDTDTGVKAAGEDGAAGSAGQNGTDGLTPYIGENGNWWIGEEDTGVKAAGEKGETGATGAQGPQGETGTNGLTPFIGENGNWWIGEEDTGVKAAGEDGTAGSAGQNGTDGLTPFIGENGNWWIGEEDTGIYAGNKNFTYELNADSASYTLIDYSGSASSIVVPETYEGLPVTAIGKSAFMSNKYIESVSLSENITTIEAYAFSFCVNLETINLPDSVTTIERYAFSNCDSLEAITIPYTVTSIGKYAFYESPSLVITCEFVTQPETWNQLWASEVKEVKWISTIADASLLEDNTEVMVKGQVTVINTAYSETYGNISVTITDETGSLYAYRLKANVALGDIIIVSGKMGTYNERQIAEGATAKIIGNEPLAATDMTISEALDSSVGTYANIKGTVTEINEVWNETYGNMSVTITDETGASIYVYRLATKVELGDVIEVTGTIDEYNSAKQIAQGATAEITEEVVAVTGVSVEESEVTIGIGGTAQINASILPANASNRTVTYSSDAEGIASVDANGKVTGVAAGTANITVDVGDKTTTVVVNVSGSVEAISTLSYTFSDYAAGTQYAEETHVLDDNTTLKCNLCHFTTQLRIYSSSTNNGIAIIESKNVITQFEFNAGYKQDVLNVYGSVDGETYTLIEGVSITATSYNDYSVSIDKALGYKYLKIDVAGDQQVRIASFSLTIAGTNI